VTQAACDRLAAFLDDALGDRAPLVAEPMAGGGSCEVFALTRGGERWVLRRAPARASSATAHDVTREFRILDAIKDSGARVPRPVVACDDPSVFGAAFYVMERVDGVPIRSGIPEAWTGHPEQQHRAFEELLDAIAEVHVVDWQAAGLGGLGHPARYLERQVPRWLAQLESYDGRELAAAHRLGGWLDANRPPDQAPALFHGDYKADNVLYAPDSPPQLLAIVDWEMASIGDPLVDVAWAMIFHPGPGKALSLGVHGAHAFDADRVPPAEQLLARYAARSGRDLTHMRWYDVFARWKLAIALEGSYVKWQRGESAKPVHEYFGRQADLLLAEAEGLLS
jgi:aminoglycoside phosphotransferase (APT) family kinase protein